MNSSWFDDLTKALATATTRRQALRRIGGILGGTALAGLFPGLALANNSACAHFCASVFGADTPAADQCTSDAAHHKGLCYTCGPASSGGTKPICCPKNGSGYCSSYSSATCCSAGQVCQNGTCVTPTTTTSTTTSTTTTPSCIANQQGSCSANTDCCSDNCSNGVCCASGQTGCGTDCCLPGHICCNGTCCDSGQICCDGKCCVSGQICCGGNTCCDSGQCCLGMCCPPGKTCNGDTCQ